SYSNLGLPVRINLAFCDGDQLRFISSRSKSGYAERSQFDVQLSSDFPPISLHQRSEQFQVYRRRKSSFPPSGHVEPDRNSVPPQRGPLSCRVVKTGPTP